MSDFFSDEHLTPNYNAPSPQADELKIVLETLEGIVRGGWSVEEWCEFYGYNKRQYDYYLNANKWLGFVEGSPKENKPSNLGVHFVKQEKSTQYSLLKRIIMKDPVFNETKDKDKSLRIAFAQSKMLDHQDLWKTASLTTMKRRATTVKNWLRLLKL